MRRPTIVRRVPPAPTDEDFFIRLTTDALIGLIADLRRRLERGGRPRSVAQVLLAEAHIDEAVGLLRTIQPAPGAHELDVRRPTAQLTRGPRRSLLRGQLPNPVRAVGA